MTNEMLQKAKECKSAEELLALAKENGIVMTAEEAAENYEALHHEGELSDDELDSASGGSCYARGGWLVVTAFHVCDYWIHARCGCDKDTCTCTGGMTRTGRPRGVTPECQSCKYVQKSGARYICKNENNK